MRILLIINIVIIYIFTGCATKIDIRALQPAKIGDPDIKQVSVSEFKNDSIAMKYTIISKMNKITFNGAKYFTVVNRDITNSILKEQRLQDSGIVASNRNIQELKSVNAILSGTVNSKDYNKQFYYKEVIDYSRCVIYSNNKCIRYARYNKKCENNQYDMDVIVFINKVSNGNTIYQRDFNKHKEIKRCDYHGSIKSKYQVFKSMANSIADELIKDITPTYVYYNVEVIDKSDIDLNDKQNNLFKQAIKSIEDKNIKLANSIFKKLTFLTKHKSYAILYDYGLTFESLEDLEQALLFYKKAKSVSLEAQGNKNILSAITRVNKSLVNRQKAKKQINN